ncbi:DUF4166 domain-containing protein [Devosia sp.]|uniref:DUF4166 domain-containing protein n=1 Tax=Devosia sp. TaxID=1871048 RepID=UPI003A953FA0
MSRPHVLIVGAGGVFGARLARMLARRHAFRITLAGRTESHIVPLQRELAAIDGQGEYGFVTLDRETIGVERLREIACQVVVDCSGPFQTSGTKLITAAIGARCHYLDLADARSFVAAIGNFDSAARAVGIAVISGASTTPGLTHAVIDHYAGKWRDIDSIDVAIVPGNRTPKGRAVIASILSWVGQPVRVFREARWQEAAGWSGGRHIRLEGLKRRQAFLAELPDLDLLPRRYSPRVRAEFAAGMELGILNRMLQVASWVTRLGLVSDASLFTAPGTMVAQALDRFGTDEGGMQIEVAGRDARGDSRVMRWSLVAKSGDGPYVPVVVAAALVAGLVAGHGPLPGARSAAGLVSLEQIKPWLDPLQVETNHLSYRGEKPLFARVIGADFEHLPEVTRRLHRGRPAVIGDGEALVIPARGALARRLSRAFGLPTEPGEQPLRVVIESRAGEEHWTRFFGTQAMRSVMRQPGSRKARKGSGDPPSGHAPDTLIEERFGPMRATMRLTPRGDGLDMHLVSARFGWVPLFGPLKPVIKAEERVDADGNHRFDVDIGLPLIGRLVAYRGYLKI